MTELTHDEPSIPAPPRSVAGHFGRVARRPRWIAALVLALGIAAGFAGLGQWQLSRSIDTVGRTDAARDTEVAVPLTSVAHPDSPVLQPQLGQRVTVDATSVPGDWSVLSDRNNGTASGYWLVGHLVTDDKVSLAVAVGWAPDRATAEKAEASAELSGTLSGRYLPSESPIQSNFEASQQSAMAVPELINEWPKVGSVYGGYLVLAQPTPGLEKIISPEPVREVSFNLLNVFYAIEWVLFAGFAIYLWYRIVRDAVEKELGEPTVD
ncbi:MAG TPA: SURF1 family cytochrome oxidase biogenesis protein [Pseudolysinimonas sp.]|nr:SURF1 family cytochrome oxidase biogenesis protein [Pseudolysinimonas sp.]